MAAECVTVCVHEKRMVCVREIGSVHDLLGFDGERQSMW